MLVAHSVNLVTCWSNSVDIVC